MNPTPELVASVQQDRERSTARDRVARLAACVRDCCKPAMIADRVARALRLVARALRLAPEACRGETA